MEDIKIGLIIAQLINFGIIFWIFKKYVADSLIKAVHERRSQLENSANAEKKAQAQLDKANAEAKTILEKARTKAAGIESHANELSKDNTAKTLEKAASQAEHLLETGKAQVEKIRWEMVAAMKAKVVDLSLKLNSKMFDKESANKEFMEKGYDSLTK